MKKHESKASRNHEDAIIKMALDILESRLRHPGFVCDSPFAVKSYLRLRQGQHEHEVFDVLFLDARHSVIAIEEMFRGTLTHTSVYQREVVKRALHHNAAAVIFAHNHPSGVAEPSVADVELTIILKAALRLVDVMVLDHVICGGRDIVSMAALDWQLPAKPKSKQRNGPRASAITKPRRGGPPKNSTNTAVHSS